MSDQPKQLASNDPCINWPCAKGAGHPGPCGTMPDTIYTANFTRDEVRKKLEEVAAITALRNGGSWMWLDEMRLRIYTSDGEAFMTLTMERQQ